MKIFLCGSKHAYIKMEPIKQELEEMGHSIILPNSYNDPMRELRVKVENPNEHILLKQHFFLEQEKKIATSDALLVINVEKNGQENYIGGATFLEIFKAWELKKKIFLYNPIPKSNFEDELIGINPIVIHNDLSLIK